MQMLTNFVTLVWVANLVSRPTDKFQEMNLFQRFGNFMLVGFLGIMGFVTITRQESAHKSGKDAFETKSTSAASLSNIILKVSQPEADAFRVIVIYENNQRTKERLASATWSDANVVSQIQEKSAQRLIYDANKFQLGNLPPVMYWQKIVYAPDTFEQRTFGKSDVMPIYAIFKSPNAIHKLKLWAKNNGYKNWEFQLKYESGWGKNSSYTEELDLVKPGSNIGVVGFFQGSNGLYMWDGVQTHDCSGGINSSGEANQCSRYVNWLEKIGE